MRVLALAAASLLVVGVCMAQTATASIRHTTNIPAEPLSVALRTLAKQRGFEVLFRADLVRDVRSSGAVGELTSEEALQQLLKGTGLTYRYLDEKTVTVIPTNAPKPSATNPAPGSEEGKSSASRDFRLAQVDQGSSVVSPGSDSRGATPEDSASIAPRLEEIVVTAQKREERLQDVPVPVSALDAQSLQESNQLRLQDYYTLVPGLSVTTGGFNGASTLSIRGVTTGITTTPTVGIVIDDVPYGASTAVALGTEAPDIDPSELARVEVLRGPQGTLYGASSIGGLLKYVTLDPSTSALRGRVEAGVSTVYNGSEGYNVRGAVNVPLTDSLAVRASAFTRKDPGYIDNVQTHQDGINQERTSGGRLSALWRPSETVSLKLSALLQHSKLDGSPEVDQGLGDLQQSRLIDTGWYDKTIQAYSVTLKAKWGAFDLTALTGYNINRWQDSYDFTWALGPIVQDGVPGTGFDGFGVSGTPLRNNVRTNKFTQEVRLAAPIGPRVDWLFGLFYNHESTQYSQNILAVNPASGTAVGTFLYDTDPTAFTEYAAFTDVMLHLTQRFDLQLGARESQNEQTYEQLYAGPYDTVFFGLASPVLEPKIGTKDNSFTYLVTPQYRVSSSLMLYARLASGYRPGGPNPNYLTGQVPPAFGPDRTQNYELGAKGDFLEHMISFDASLYYINWKDIQLSLYSPITFGGYTGNASRAKSQGLELSVAAKPVRGLTFTLWTAFNDAKLTAALPTGVAGVSSYGIAGDRLPYSARFSGNASVEDEFPLAGKATGFVAAAVSYVGARQDVFSTTAARQDLPAYAKTDVRGGVRYEGWTVNLFVNNLTDRRGLLTGGVGTLNPEAFYYIQPRTAGLSVSRSF